MNPRRARIWEWLAGALGVALAVSPALAWFGCGSEASSGPCVRADSLSGWEAFAVTDVVLLVAGLAGVAVLALTLGQSTPAVGLALTAVAALVALVATGFAVIALARGPDAGGAEASARLVGAWLGAFSALGLLLALLAAMRDESVPVAARGIEGADPEPQLLTLARSGARDTAPGEAQGRGGPA